MRTRQSHPIHDTFGNKNKIVTQNKIHVNKIHVNKKNAVQKENKTAEPPIPRNYITFSKKMTSLFKKKYPSLSHVAIMSKVYQSWKSLRAKGTESFMQIEPRVEKQEKIVKNEATDSIPVRLTSDDRAQCQVEYYQHIHKDPIVSKYTVRRMIKPYLDHSDPNETPFKVKEEALYTILSGMERYIVNTFSKASKLTGHRSRKSLTVNDISMLMDLVAPAPEKDLGTDRVDDEFDESGSEEESDY